MFWRSDVIFIRMSFRFGCYLLQQLQAVTSTRDLRTDTMSSTTSTTSSKHSTKHGSKQTTFAKQSARKSEQNVSTYDSRHVVGKTYVATETMPVPSYRPLSESSFRPIEPVYATIAPKAE